MNLSTKNKLSLSLALAVCLCVPVGAYANSGGTPDTPTSGSYTGVYKTEVNEVATTGDVTIDTDVTGSVYGGYSKQGDAISNKVTIDAHATSAVTIGNSIYGGYSTVSAVKDNEVLISNVTVKSAVYGGSGSSVATGNKVTVINSTVSTNVIGGTAENDASNNNVTISGANTKVKRSVYGGRGTYKANDNEVTISGGEVTQTVYGGQSDNGIANGNKVIITGGTVNPVMGGSGATGASNNQVNISGDALMNADIIGGVVTANGDASNNSIVISAGQTLTGNIFGGQLAGDNDAINNTITIEGTADINAQTQIYGGYSNTAIVNGDIRSGNTLNIYKSGVSVTTVDNFQHYDLAIAPSATTLTVNDSLALQAGDTIKSTKVLSEMNVGDTTNLLESKGTLTIDPNNLVNGKATQGILYRYGYELKMENGKLLAEIISKEGNDQSMSVADGQLAAMGMLRSGADLVASAAMNNAAKANTEYDTFAAMNYTNISMDSVSSVDVQGSSMLVGMGRNITHTNSNLTVGAFLEAGWGTYESSLGVARAKGHTNYYGVGVLARNNANSGIYTEGSLRVGKIGNTYSGNTIEDGTYDVSSTYYGLHLGVGKINKINDTTSTDIYAKYFYAHEGGTSANIAGDNFNFDSIDSHRVRIGGRLNSLNKNINRYVGLAYEYEFSGKATATAYGVDIATPTAKGSSGILELGLVYKPTTESKFSMDMGMNGYVGKRKGITGNVTLNWGF